MKKYEKNYHIFKKFKILLHIFKNMIKNIIFLSYFTYNMIKFGFFFKKFLSESQILKI